MVSIITEDNIKKITYLLTALLIFTYSNVKCETFETNYNYYSAFAADDDNFYIGLHNGFVVQNIETGKAKYYNSINSSLGTNYIDDIAVHKGTVYISGPGGLFTYADGTFKEIELGGEGARKIQLVDDILWTYDGSSIYKYDGIETKVYDIGQSINFKYEIAQIDIYNNYIWISMYRNVLIGKTNYYSTSQTYDFRYALLNTNDNSVKTFTDVERGYPFGTTTWDQTISNDEVWISVAGEKSFIYDIAENKWRVNEYVDLVPKGYVFSHRYLHTDEKGDVWFSIIHDSSEVYKSMPAVYNYNTHTITMKFQELEGDSSFLPAYYSSFNEGVFMSGGDAFYFARGDSLEIINKTEISNGIFYQSELAASKGDYYMMITDAEKPYEDVRIINLNKNERTEYSLNNNSTLPIPVLNSYVVDNNFRIAEGSNNIIMSYYDFIKTDSEWLRVEEFGIKNGVSYLKHGRFVNGDIVFQSGSLLKSELFGIKDNNIVAYDNLNEKEPKSNSVIAFKVKNDYIYALGSYYKSDSVLNSFISVLNRDNISQFLYNMENSCLPDFEQIGQFFITYIDSVPKSIEVDNQGNIWVLTTKSLFRINDKLDCEFMDNIPFDSFNSLAINYLSHSSVESIMYGYWGNTLYNLNSPMLDTVNVIDQGLSDINYFGACSDGNVYLTTKTGGLYRVKNIKELIPIEVVPGKKELGIPINHVSYFKDTLYVSTDVGLFKVDNRLTSVENVGNQISSNLFYPNPSSDYINIEATNQPVTIISLTGRIMKQVTGESRIDISFLSSGIYFVRIGDRIEKLIKY